MSTSLILALTRSEASCIDWWLFLDCFVVEDCGVAVAAVALPPVAACDGVTAEAPRDGDCWDEFDARVNKDADAAAKPRMGDTAKQKN